MKKYAYFIIASILSWTAIHAQPTMSYEFESTSGTFKDITGGTVVGTGLSGTALEAVAYIGNNETCKSTTTATGFPVGFDFIFNNQKMNQFAIGTNGYLILGKDEVTVTDPNVPFNLAGSGKATNVISSVPGVKVFGSDTTEISYKVSGEAPNRVLAVQYKNLGLTEMYNVTKVASTVQLQFRLYETSNKIDIIYKDWKTTFFGMTVRVGIKGTITNDRLLIKTGSTPSWDKDLQTATVDATSMMWNSNCYPADGLTYTFTPPADCTMPETQPTGLALASYSTFVEGSFKKSMTADHYLVLMSEAETLSKLPENGATYNANDTLGEATVISFDTANVFKTPEILASTKSYYFHVFGTNSLCMYGPKYNTSVPLAGTTVTKPDRPDTLFLAESGLDKMLLNTVANATNDKVLIAVTTEAGKNQYGQLLADGVFGQPIGDLNVGDAIEGGGTVVYKGEAKENIEIKDLKENTLYHFKAYSFNKEGIYSTIGQTVNGITWGKVPYKADFSKMPLYIIPVGWEREGDLFRTFIDLEKDATLECNIMTADPGGLLNSATSPWIELCAGVNRIVFDYNMSMGGNAPYNNWEDRDNFEIQVSKNGTNFETIHQINKRENTPTFATTNSYVRVYAPFEQYAGEKIKIRFRWVCYKNIRVQIKNLRVEEKASCDYPINASVEESSIVGKQAKISWISQGEEDTWEIRYKKAESEEWGEPAEVRTNPYLCTDLPNQSNLELQVRAKCSATSQSVWSDKLSFRTAYGLPLLETFEGLSALPKGWNFETGAITDSTTFCTGYCSKQWAWQLSNNVYGVNIVGRAKTADEWILCPVIDLEDGSVNYNFNFEIVMTSPVQDNDETYSIVISTDGGKTFSNTNVLKEIAKSELPAKDERKTYSASLKGYKGQVRMAIYVKSTTGYVSSATLTSVSVTESCPSDVVATVSDLTSKSAKVTWEGTADNWLVFSRLAGSAEKDYKVQTGKELVLTELQSLTAYEVGITKMCEVSDTAKVVIASFTTLAVPECVTPTNLAASDIEASTVRLSWDADESNLTWNLRYRPTGDTSWTNEEGLNSKNYQLENLTPNTVYLWSVKATCDEGSTSAWASDKELTTLVSGIQSTDYASLKVFVSNKILNIVNAGHVWMKQLQIYTMNGQLMNTYDLNTDENALLPMVPNNNQVIVKINGENWSRSYVVVFK